MHEAKHNEEVLPEARDTAAPKRKHESFKINDDEDAELTKLYKMLSVTDSKTKELESSMQSMSEDMGEMEKKIAAQTQMVQSLAQ